jgi:hypothetical protein
MIPGLYLGFGASGGGSWPFRREVFPGQSTLPATGGPIRYATTPSPTSATGVLQPIPTTPVRTLQTLPTTSPPTLQPIPSTPVFTLQPIPTIPAVISPTLTIRAAMRGIPDGFGQSPTDLQSLGGAVMSAFAADPNGCSNVCINGTGVNNAVHAFKVAWNQTGWGVDPVPAGTPTLPGADAFASYGPLAHNGQYDDACATAIAATGLTGVLGGCSTPCNAAPVPQPTSVPTLAPTAAPSGGGGAGGRNLLPWILGGAAVVGLGVVGWAMYRKPKAAELHGRARAMESEAKRMHAAAREYAREERRR